MAGRPCDAAGLALPGGDSPPGAGGGVVLLRWSAGEVETGALLVLLPADPGCRQQPPYRKAVCAAVWLGPRRLCQWSRTGLVYGTVTKLGAAERSTGARGRGTRAVPLLGPVRPRSCGRLIQLASGREPGAPEGGRLPSARFAGPWATNKCRGAEAQPCSRDTRLAWPDGGSVGAGLGAAGQSPAALPAGELR